MVETRVAQKQHAEELQSVREELVRLRTQLAAARWVATPFVAAVVAGLVTLLIKRFGG
jgi:phosphate/sulfate permease